MRLFRRDRLAYLDADNPLVPVVAPLPPQGKRAMYAAANAGVLRRKSWDGCPFNQGGSELGTQVHTHHEAAVAFHTRDRVVSQFIEVWDHLPGDDETCTQLLRDALEHVGLFTPAGTLHRQVEDEHQGHSEGPGTYIAVPSVA